MQEYIITGFVKTIGTAVIWYRQETGSKSGGYAPNNSAPDVEMRLNDFLCNDVFKIYSVMRPTGTTGNGQLQGINFKLGDRVNIGSFIQRYIASFSIEKGKVIVHTAPTVGGLGTDTIRLVDLKPWVEPVVQPVVKKKNTAGENEALLPILETIQQKNPRPVRLEKTLKKRKETPKQFLKKFFTEWNAEKRTIYADDLSTQTAPNKRRSLGDIYMIMKYYYPNITLNEVSKLLYVDLVEEFGSTGFRSSWCSVILKRVWYYNESREAEVCDKLKNDEYGKPHRWWIENII